MQCAKVRMLLEKDTGVVTHCSGDTLGQQGPPGQLHLIPDKRKKVNKSVSVTEFANSSRTILTSSRAALGESKLQGLRYESSCEGCVH